MEDDRLNSPSTSAVSIEVLGHQLHLSQDPNSKHLGTTVWDASIVFIKFLEKNCRKGKFSKLKGKRAIELGAGCGLAGIGMALLGCNVVSTDQIEVLPLLMRNVQRSCSWISQANPNSEMGSIEVMELNWGNKDHIMAVDPPFDYIIGTDIVYAEHLLEPLLHTLLSLSNPRTTILLGYEMRSMTVHEQMIHMWKDVFNVRSVPKTKMDEKYQHPSIQLFEMSWKVRSRPEDFCFLDGVLEHASIRGHGDTDCPANGGGKDSGGEGLCAEKVDEWDARRAGAMAARLLQDVKLL